MVPELKDLAPRTGDVLSGQIVGLLISVGAEVDNTLLQVPPGTAKCIRGAPSRTAAYTPTAFLKNAADELEPGRSQ